jgi:hypothetical protein
MSAAIKAGQAYVEIATKQGAFDKGMAQVQAAMGRLKAVATSMGTGIGKGFASAQGALSSFSKSVVSLPSMIAGSIAVTGLVAMAKGFADAGSAVDDMAQRTGMGAESVSALGYAAKMSGTDIGAVEKGVRKMQLSIADAAAGAPDAIEKFAAIGLSVADLQKMTPDQQFIAIADKLSKIEDPALKSAAAMEYFGKSGADMVPLLSEGGEGIRRLMDDANRLGQTMSGEDAAAAGRLGDVFDQLFGVIGGLQNRIGAALAPTLISLGEKIIGTISWVSDWISNNRELIVTIAQWTAVGAGLVAGLIALGGAAGIVAAGMTAIATIGSVVGTVFGVIAGAIGMIVSPVGLVVAGLTAAAVAALYFSGVGGELVGYLGAKFTELKDIALPVFDAIKTALTSGQWAAAGKVAMTGLELVFRVATRDLYAGWLDFTTGALNAWTTFSAEVSAGGVGFVANLINILAGIPTGIAKGFATAMVWLEGTFDQTVNWIAKKLLYLYSLIDKSVDYEKAAKQMDVEASKRAASRQQGLDSANAKRDEELQTANRGRLQVAAEMQNTIRGNAQQTMQNRADANEASLAGFNQRIGELTSSLQSQTQEINKTAQQNPGGFMGFLQGVFQGVSKTIENAASQTSKRQIPTYEQVKSTTATQMGGTFSGFGAERLGTNTSALDRVADQTAKSNQLLAQIAKNTSQSSSMSYGS